MGFTDNAYVAIVANCVTFAKLNNGDFCHNCRRVAEPQLRVKHFMVCWR